MTLICLTAETAETALRIFIVHPGRDLNMKKNNLYSLKDYMSVTDFQQKNLWHLWKL